MLGSFGPMYVYSNPIASPARLQIDAGGGLT